MTAAFAIAAALVGRARSGEGPSSTWRCWIPRSPPWAGWCPTISSPGASPCPWATKISPPRLPARSRPATGLLNISANKQEQFVALTGSSAGPTWRPIRAFAERENRKKNRPALTVEIEKELAAKSALAWEEAFNKAGIPAGRVRSVPEALNLPNTKHRTAAAPGRGRPGRGQAPYPDARRLYRVRQRRHRHPAAAGPGPAHR